MAKKIYSSLLLFGAVVFILNCQAKTSKMQASRGKYSWNAEATSNGICTTECVYVVYYFDENANFVTDLGQEQISAIEYEVAGHSQGHVDEKYIGMIVRTKNSHVDAIESLQVILDSSVELNQSNLLVTIHENDPDYYQAQNQTFHAAGLIIEGYTPDNFTDYICYIADFDGCTDATVVGQNQQSQAQTTNTANGGNEGDAPADDDDDPIDDGGSTPAPTRVSDEIIPGPNEGSDDPNDSFGPNVLVVWTCGGQGENYLGRGEKGYLYKGSRRFQCPPTHACARAQFCRKSEGNIDLRPECQDRCRATNPEDSQVYTPAKPGHPAFNENLFKENLSFDCPNMGSYPEFSSYWTCRGNGSYIMSCDSTGKQYIHECSCSAPSGFTRTSGFDDVCTSNASVQ